jgi:hypothetical protein
VKLGIVCATTMLMWLGGCAGMVGPPVSSTRAQVQDILTEVQKTLLVVADKAPSGLPPLHSVTLTLETEWKRTDDNTFSLYVVSFGKSGARTDTQTLVLALTPPVKGAAVEDYRVEKGFSEQLSKAILDAANAAQSAQTGKPPLKVSELTATVKFVVVESRKAGMKWDVTPVSVDLGREASSSETHTIEVSFKAPEKKE